jgi:SAM-dependent methyltransferase
MREEIHLRLLRLNREFYQNFAKSFAETRLRLQPGVTRVLEAVPPSASVLDLGCGHGEVAQWLALHGHQGAYLGLDSSAVLLTMACQRSTHPRVRFQQAELTDPDWAEGLRPPSSDADSPPSKDTHDASFDRIFAFAVIHHIPGAQLRQRFLRQVHGLLNDNGEFVFSVWNFMSSPRLRKRVIAWKKIGLRPEEVEPDDYLLDWRRGGYGLRYVHLFDEDQLGKLASTTGFQVVDTAYSDGENGRLGLYQAWKKVFLSEE